MKKNLSLYQKYIGKQDLIDLDKAYCYPSEMHQDFISKNAWFLIISTAIIRFAYFATIPFLTLMLSRSHMDLTSIGIIISVGPITGVFAGSLGGHLSDKIGRLPLVMGSIGASALIFFALSFFNASPLALIFFNILLGISTSLGEPIIQAILADLHQGRTLAKIFAYRYAGVNIAVALSSLAGAILSLIRPSYCFALSGALYFLIFLAFFSLKRSAPNLSLSKNSSKLSYFKNMHDILADRSFILLLSSFIIMGFTYNQIGTTLALHFSYYLPHAQTASENLQVSPFLSFFSFLKGDFTVESAFSLTILINTLMVVFLQKPSLFFQKFFSRQQLVSMGLLIMLPSFFLFSLSGKSLSVALIALIIITLGEILVMPNIGVLVDEVAPKEKRGAYYGFFSFNRIGGACSGLAGGFLMEQSSPLWTWFIIGLIHILSLFFFMKSQKEAIKIVSSPII